MKRCSFFVLIAILLFGCAVKNPNDLRSDHYGKISFTVHKGYQEVYRNLVEHKDMPVHEMKSEIYTDIKSGKIYFRSAVTPFDSFVLIDILHIEDKMTEVNYYYYFPAWKRFGEDLKKEFQQQ